MPLSVLVVDTPAVSRCAPQVQKKSSPKEVLFWMTRKGSAPLAPTALSPPPGETVVFGRPGLGNRLSADSELVVAPFEWLRVKAARKRLTAAGPRMWLSCAVTNILRVVSTSGQRGSVEPTNGTVCFVP